MLIVIQNHFEKHANHTSQIKIVIYKKILLLEKDKLLSKQKDIVSTFNKYFRLVTDLINLFSWPKDILMSSANDTINFIIKKIWLSAKYKNNKE